jgi:hypothetical protein
MIWKYAMGPRFITWLDKQLLPSVLHACFESRSLWLKHHKIEHWKSSLFDRETMFIDYSSDIMHFNREIPGMHGWTEFPKLITDLKTGWLRHGAWLKEVERLAVSYESAMKEFDVPPMRFYRDPDPGSRWKKLSAWCPKLKELIVVLGADGQGDIGDKEWMEIGKVVLPIEPWCWRWDTPNFRVDSFKAGRLAKLRNIEVKFVKVKNTA